MRNFLLAGPGLITGVEFQDRKCPAGTASRRNLEQLVAVRPDIAIRVVEIADLGWRQSDDKYGVAIRSVPHPVIMDRDERVPAESSTDAKDASVLLYDWIEKEVARKSQRMLGERLLAR